MADLNVNRLKCLRELDRCGSIAAAADALWLTPSAVSQQLAALQKETGVQLIERAGRGVTLTSAGRTLVHHAERVFSALGEAEAVLSASRHEPIGCLRVAMLPSLIRTTLPIMEAMRAEHDGLEFEIEDLETEQALASLDCGRTDLAVVDRHDWVAAKQRFSFLDATELFADPLVVVHATGRDFGEAPLAWTDLADEPWVIGQPAWSFMTPLFESYNKAGGTPQVVARVRDLATALGVVRQGWAVTALPRLAVAGHGDDIAWRIATPLLHRRMVAVTRQHGAATPAIRMLVERLSAASSTLASSSRSVTDEGAAHSSSALSRAGQHL